MAILSGVRGYLTVVLVCISLVISSTEQSQRRDVTVEVVMSGHKPRNVDRLLKAGKNKTTQNKFASVEPPVGTSPADASELR